MYDVIFYDTLAQSGENTVEKWVLIVKHDEKFLKRFIPKLISSPRVFDRTVVVQSQNKFRKRNPKFRTLKDAIDKYCVKEFRYSMNSHTFTQDGQKVRFGKFEKAQPVLRGIKGGKQEAEYVMPSTAA